MRIATWNVNSLKARQDAVEKWLKRAEPDVLLMQETKLADQDAPVMAFAMAGYELIHHGEGRWNGVAIAVRHGMSASRTWSRTSATGRSATPARAATASDTSEEDFDPLDEARMVAVTVDGIRIVSLYAPNGRVVGSPFYTGKLAWYRPAGSWLRDELADPGDDRWSSAATSTSPRPMPTSGIPSAAHGGTHVSRARSARRSERLLEVGPGGRVPAPATTSRGRFTWWDYRAGMFHKNFGMRIDHLLVTKSVAARVVDAEIDREARKGPPVPSDHAPLTIDLDKPGKPFDPDWDGALKRIASRSRGAARRRDGARAAQRA